MNIYSNNYGQKEFTRFKEIKKERLTNKSPDISPKKVEKTEKD
jgi:hypothetical protein